MYLMDMSHTNGHTHGISNGVWSRVNKNQIATCSIDSTIRLWDVERPKKNLSVIKHKTARAGKAGVNVCQFSGDNKLVAGGCSDGSIQVWASGGPFTRPQFLLRNAHDDGCVISSLQFGKENTLLSRADDNFMKRKSS